MPPRPTWRGCGITWSAGGTHELAQEVDSASRIVYVDNDPVVSAHARALVLSRPEGVVSYLQADAREPAAIIDAAGTPSTSASQPRS